MKLRFYPETASLYIEVLCSTSVETSEIVDGISIDLNARGELALISTIYGHSSELPASPAISDEVWKFAFGGNNSFQRLTKLVPGRPAPGVLLPNPLEFQEGL